jgi:uncharacterized protein YjbI with pentapeptide repeats
MVRAATEQRGTVGITCLLLRGLIMRSERESKMKKHIGLTLFGILTIFVIATTLWWLLIKFPEWYLSSRRAGLTLAELQTAENALRTIIVQALGGAALLVGLIFTYRNVKIAQETASNNSKTSEATLRLSEEGKLTERFSKAIEQLGNKGNLAICLGGIYALERIAKDSKRDHWQIMEVLTAYVRENAPWQGIQTRAQLELSHITQDIGDNNEDPHPRKLATEIQAILTVIGRRSHITVGQDAPLDLNNTDLRNLILYDAKVSHINLNCAHLEGADITFTEINFAHGNGAHFEGATLIGVQLNSTRLNKAHFEKAKLTVVYLERADLSGAHFQEATLHEVILKNANLSGAHFQGATLQEVDLDEANLQGTHFEGADMSGATGVTMEKIKGAHIDSSTILPSELTVTQNRKA